MQILADECQELMRQINLYLKNVPDDVKMKIHANMYRTIAAITMNDVAALRVHKAGLESILNALKSKYS